MSNKRPWSIAELTEMVDQGRLIERERIIKLLEPVASHYGCSHDCQNGCTTPTWWELIALIKGEQK